MTTTLSGESEYRLLIGGEFQPGGDGTYDIVNPATEEVVGAAQGGGDVGGGVDFEFRASLVALRLLFCE